MHIHAFKHTRAAPSFPNNPKMTMNEIMKSGKEGINIPKQNPNFQQETTIGSSQEAQNNDLSK
jgi:hypothetical protein